MTLIIIDLFNYPILENYRQLFFLKLLSFCDFHDIDKPN